MSDPDTSFSQRLATFVRSISWLVECERSRPEAIARENYIRALMGLPPVSAPRRDEDAGK
jgi:hypothetical protein